MTFKEKFEKEFPEKAAEFIFPWWNCPSGHFDDPATEDGKCPYFDAPLEMSERCTICWNRTIPGTETKINKKGEETMTKNHNTTRKTKDELLNEIASLKKRVNELERFEKYAECANEMKAMYDANVDAGFNHDQAFELLKISITAASNLNKR